MLYKLNSYIIIITYFVRLVGVFVSGLQIEAHQNRGDVLLEILCASNFFHLNDVLRSNKLTDSLSLLFLVSWLAGVALISLLTCGFFLWESQYIFVKDILRNTLEFLLKYVFIVVSTTYCM